LCHQDAILRQPYLKLDQTRRYAQLLSYQLAEMQLTYEVLSKKPAKMSPLPSKKLKKAVMALEGTLGYTPAETLVYDLENYGIALVAGKAASYTLDQIENAMKNVLGDEAASLVMEPLMKILEREE
jgi:hypothetical protein